MLKSMGEIHYIKYMDACAAFAERIAISDKNRINSYYIKSSEKSNFRNCLVLGTLLNFTEKEIVLQIKNLIRTILLTSGKFRDWQKQNYNAFEENKKMNFDKISQDNTEKMMKIYTNLKNFIATISYDTDIIFSELPPFTGHFGQSYGVKEKCRYLSYILSTIIPASELRKYSSKILYKTRKSTLYFNKEVFCPLMDKDDVITFYKKALQEVLDLLVNHRVDGTLNIKKESGEINITETFSFKKWLKIAQVFGIDGNVLINDELNPKQLLSLNSLNYSLKDDDHFKLYHHLCYDSAEAEIDDREGKNDLREIALYFGTIIDIFPEATSEHIEEYKDAIWTKRFIDSFDEIIREDRVVIKSLSNDLRSWIVELRKRYQIDGISFNDSGKKARARLSYAVDSYAKEAESENIIFACDTVFMNDRFLITDKHIYIYELEKNIKHRIAINDIDRIKIPKRKKCDLNFFTNKNDSIRVKNVSNNKDTTKQILSLVNEALEHLRKINNAEK